MVRRVVASAVFAAVLIGLSLAAPARAFDPSPDILPLDRAVLFSRVVDRFYARYWDPQHFGRIQWLDKVEAARTDVLAAPTTAAAIARLNALLAETKASHTGVSGPDDLSYYVLLDLMPGAPGAPELIAKDFWGNRPHFPGIGAFTAAIDGRHFVDQVMDGSPAARAGIRTGDEIADVAGAPYTQIAAFRPHVGSTVEIGVRRRADGPIERVRVTVVPIVPGLAFQQATLASARVTTHGDLRIGYFRLWAQFNDAPIARTLARLTPGGQLRAPERQGDRVSITMVSVGDGLTTEPLDAMIVDLRGKVGGRDHSDLVLELLEGPRRGVPYTFRGRPEGRRDTSTPKRNPSFRGRAAVLIDHRTRSAGELLANSLKAARIGSVIGTTTAGHVLATQAEVVPGDYVLQYPVSRPEADGLILEGRGVDPDIRVDNPLPYSNGADPVLDAAVRDLSARLAALRVAP